MNEVEVTPQQVEDRKAALALRPKWKDLEGKPGFRKHYTDPVRPNYFEWTYDIKPNDGHGKPTREGAEMVEMLLPSIAADTERGLKLNARVPRSSLRDQDGNTQFVEAWRADETAARNGWGHRWRARGRRVERGEGGMLWAWDRGWMPLGVRCLGTPLVGSAKVSREGFQFDPDGNPWRWIAGEWRP